MKHTLLNRLKAAYQHPVEAIYHLGGHIQWRWEQRFLPTFDYVIESWDTIIDRLEEASGWPIATHLDEPERISLAAEIGLWVEALPPDLPFPTMYNADRQWAALAYAVCRALQPAIVVTTGVGYGVLEAYILQALEVNGSGDLHSIDLPPLHPAADNWIGAFIPDRLRTRWRLWRGPSARLLPRLLRDLGQVDVFVHDSLHTRRNTLRELQTMTPHLARPAVVLVDDINQNQAFHEWIVLTQPTASGILQQEDKDVMSGVSVLCGDGQS
jgi:hypothetical protein